MQLEAGPLPQLAPDASSIVPEDPQFLPGMQVDLADWPALDDELGSWIDLLDTFDVPAEFPLIDLNLDTSDEGLNELSAFSTSVHVDTAEQAVSDASEHLGLAAAEAPAEVWGPVPYPQTGTGGSPYDANQNGPTRISISNTTAPNDPNFYSGDSFQIVIQIDSGGGNFAFADRPLMLVRTINGQFETELALGRTDAYGKLVYSSTFDDSSVGDRVFGVDPPGWNTTPQLSVTVLPGPRPGGGGGVVGNYPLTAMLQNLTTGDPSLFHPLDIWRYVITGLPAQPVYLDQVKNGADQGVLFVGGTDISGELVFGGEITADEVGDYSESFRVGTQAVPQVWNFSVVLS